MMACPAAINAVRSALSSRLSPPRAQTADEIFETINWWTKETICEAIAELVVNGECEQHRPDDDAPMMFRRRPEQMLEKK